MKVDGHLLIDLKNGDEKAFETLFWKYNEHVYHFIYSLLYEKSMAEDLTQNVFLKIWEKHETIDVEQNFDAYLFTIARNLVYKETENRLLSEKLTESLQRQLSDADSLTEERIDAESLREYINSLIEELPPSRREIFRLSRHEHLSYREIAERLSISEKTVETQVNRALRFLRDRLSSDGFLRVISFFIILISLTSCGQKKEVDPQEHFQLTIAINANKLNVDTYKLSSFGRMILFEDEQCIIKENYLSESPLDKIYYTKDSILSFAQTGEGPDENIMPRLMQKKDESNVNILDIQKKQIITKSLPKDISSNVNLDYMFLSAIQTKHGYVVSGLLDKEEPNTMRYALFDCEGKYVKSFGDFPNDGNNSGGKSKTFAYQGYMAYNSLLDRFATVASSGAIFELYQIDTIPTLIKCYHDIYPIYTDDRRSGRNGIKHGKENVIGYTDIYATNRYVYALYSGKKLNQHTNAGMIDAMLSNDVLVYDWSGKCICRLVSDIKLFNICVANDDKELIALGWDDDYHLYSFDLSKVISAW